MKRIMLTTACRMIKANVVFILAFVSTPWLRVGAATLESVHITANFDGQKAVLPTTTIELRASRELAQGDGRLAVLIGDTDVTALCVLDAKGARYVPRAVHLPLGETKVIVYVVSTNNDWTEIARLPLLVKELEPAVSETNGNGASTAARRTATAKTKSNDPFQFLPSVSVNIKAQSVALFFPESSRPDRINFTDVAVQASFHGNYSGKRVAIQNQFDLAGSSVQNEALRFGDLGFPAMQLDLSSYLMQYRFSKARLSVGHISFGSNRHLINSFASRGLSISFPINKRFDVSTAFMNGTSIVGFSNFLGLSQRRHKIQSGTLGIELLTKRPGGLRIEVGALHGSLLPRSGFNQGNVSDAEKSRGASIRVFGSDKAQHLRFDGGFTRSRFTNPADPLLYQGRNVIAVRPVIRNAHYLDVSYDLLRNIQLAKDRPLNLTFAYHNEKVDPLYRSVTASAQADRINNQLDITGSMGDVSFGFNDTRANDNLSGIRSILKTLTRRNAALLSFSSGTLFGNHSKPSVWLPRVSYNFDRVHQFAAFIPTNGDFVSPAQIPDQASVNQSFSAEWQLSSTLRLGYRFNHSFQDSRQATRERNDFLNEINGATVGLNPSKNLDLNFDVNAERTSNFEQNAINTTFRIGTNVTWRMTSRMVWAINASTTGAGDRANTNHRRDADFDIQYSWRFLTTEKNRWKKVQGQFFIRYANRYGLASDRLFGFNTLTKLQTFNAGLNFIFF
jgi:hypothetical protein